MSQPSIFDREIPLPDDALTAHARTLIGFNARYTRIRDYLHLLLHADELGKWNQKYHRGRLAVTELVAEQYPLAIFHGDVGTGKTATAECIANRLVAEAHTEDSVLFKLSNGVRGTGKVGEMGTLLTEAFNKVVESAGRGRRAILVIDEGDSLGAARSQDHSHHEDKVAVNTLVQQLDDLRRFSGRILTILCTNRMSVLDPALQRRAAVIEEFRRPSDDERHELFALDLAALDLAEHQLGELVAATAARIGSPPWTYSDIRTRLYPAALARAFPKRSLEFEDLRLAAADLNPSPVVEDQS